MTDQLAFPGFDDTRPKTDRLLFLTYVDPDAAPRIALLMPDLRSQHGLRGKPVAQDRLHITLNHLGDHAGLPRTWSPWRAKPRERWRWLRSRWSSIVW